MGYYTDYTLALHDADEKQRELIAERLKKDFYMDGWGDEWYCNAKWYGHDEDMARLSIEFPTVLFELHGIGEDSEDMWNTYYKAGYIQHCPAEIIYPPYNASKMKAYKFKESI